MDSGKSAAILAALVVPLPALAESHQPVSAKLVECSVILSKVTTLAQLRNRPENEIETGLAAAAAFRDVARDEFIRRGRRDSDSTYENMLSAKEKVWEGRFSEPMSLVTYKDQIDRCIDLARDRGIDLP